MMNILSNNKLVMAAAAVVIAGAIWYGFSGGTSSGTLLGTESATSAVNAENKDIVETLLILRSVELSGTIFSSNIFRGLQDFSTEITQEPVGRTDPFAPLTASPVAPASKPASKSQPPASQTNSGNTSPLFSPLD